MGTMAGLGDAADDGQDLPGRCPPSPGHRLAAPRECEEPRHRGATPPGSSWRHPLGTLGSRGLRRRFGWVSVATPREGGPRSSAKGGQAQIRAVMTDQADPATRQRAGNERHRHGPADWACLLPPATARPVPVETRAAPRSLATSIWPAAWAGRRREPPPGPRGSPAHPRSRARSRHGGLARRLCHHVPGRSPRDRRQRSTPSSTRAAEGERARNPSQHHPQPSLGRARLHEPGKPLLHRPQVFVCIHHAPDGSPV